MNYRKSKIQEIYISDCEVFRFSDVLWELSKEQIIAVRKAQPPFRITEVYNIENSLNQEYSFCWRQIELDNIRYYQVIEIIDNIVLSHTVLWKVFEWTKIRYSIDFLCEPYKVKEGRNKIAKYDVGVQSLADLEYFDSISDLKLNSATYKKLSSEEKQWICNPKNILKIQGEIPTLDFGDGNATGKFLKHLILGDFSKGNYGGVHHINQVLSGNARIEEVKDKPNDNGVWRGRLSVKDLRFTNNSKNDWKEKDELSTFFPNNWEIFKLIIECKSAWDNKTLELEQKYSKRWKSTTESGIAVVIFTDLNNNILTIYPDWEIERTFYNK